LKKIKISQKLLEAVVLRLTQQKPELLTFGSNSNITSVIPTVPIDNLAPMKTKKVDQKVQHRPNKPAGTQTALILVSILIELIWLWLLLKTIGYVVTVF
jgi:hypothetical protein